MDRKSPKFVMQVVLGLLSVIPACAAQKPVAGKKTQFHPVQLVPASQPQGTATPLSLEEIPAAAPQVLFRSGNLTIVARNSSLAAILQQVQTQTGASVDMPGNPTDRVVGQFGPGPAREVLASLLNGSHYNYVLLGSPENPSALDRVVLLSKSVPDAGSSPQSAASAQPMLPRQNAVITPDDDPQDDNAADMANTDQNPPDAQADGEPNTQPNVDQNGQPAIKTPQQLLQELQRQRQAQPTGVQPPPQQN